MNKILEGSMDASDLKIAIVTSKWNKSLTDALHSGAKQFFLSSKGNTDNLLEVRPSGAYEIPLVCKKLILAKGIDAVVTLGVLVKGDTDHYEHVSNAVERSLSQLNLETNIPIAFGIISSPTMEYAEQRAGGSMGNKGSEAMAAAIEQANLLKQIGR